MGVSGAWRAPLSHTRTPAQCFSADSLPNPPFTVNDADHSTAVFVPFTFSTRAETMLYYCRTAKSLNNLNELADEKSEYSERFIRRDVACSAHERQSIRQHEIDFVVNRGNDKIYIQSALRIDDAAKDLQETLSLRKTGDFFKKIVITDGYGEARSDVDGIIRVGVIPFMLDETILKRL